MKKLFYGDNLQVLRDNIGDETVDLIYLDPPFNSKADYNVLFSTPRGERSEAQITAFEDTWEWGTESVRSLQSLVTTNGNLAELLDLLVRTLGKNSLSAYLVMMAVRLVELHRVLKSTGSLYLHCDPTASHYLKMILDVIFEPQNFKSEIVWKRTSAHNSARRFAPVHDVILFYTKSDRYTWNLVYQTHNKDYLESKYRYGDERGIYRLDNLTAPGVRNGESGASWRDINPSDKGNHWKIHKKTVESIVGVEQAKKLGTLAKLDLLDQHQYIYWTPKGRDGHKGFPQFKRYLGEGVTVQDLILDVAPLNSQAKERLGYPTQKPLALLERIVAASSNPGDVVLDPFCGCGTAVHAAERLGRSWIGIDITHLAIALIEKRLRDAFPGIEFSVEGTPQDLEGAKDLANRDKYQFQYWACSLVNAQPYKGKKKGADGGIDGQIFFSDAESVSQKNPVIRKIIVSVKGGQNVSLTMLKDLIATVEGNKAAMGLFVTLASPTKPMIKEAASAGFYKSAGNGRDYPKIQILTIEGLLNGTERPEYFDMNLGGLNFKAAETERGTGISQGQLF
ncbi:MAG: site-specific DNA-methyltransferase [Limnothrix sp. CACIAM 69d]|nr:MAG: site-specific DNA-methyltransferase [Limnothrix sp. CACIAM 69d]